MKESKADRLRKWGLPYPQFQWGHLRYKHPYEKGVLWYYTSLYVRKRDVSGYGKCISCGKVITMETCDAGHFIPAASCGRDLLFDLENIHAECSRCNAFDGGHLLGYEKGLNERYGEDLAKRLKNDYFDRKIDLRDGKTERDYTAQQYANSALAVIDLFLQETKDVVL